MLHAIYQPPVKTNGSTFIKGFQWSTNCGQNQNNLTKKRIIFYTINNGQFRSITN